MGKLHGRVFVDTIRTWVDCVFLRKSSMVLRVGGMCSSAFSGKEAVWIFFFCKGKLFVLSLNGPREGK